jgi:hypothetical protein
MIKWVSEWLLFNADSAIFQLYHGENKLIFIKIEPTIYRTRGEHANHYTMDAA